jgi:hypothetical protein
LVNYSRKVNATLFEAWNRIWMLRLDSCVYDTSIYID